MRNVSEERHRFSKTRLLMSVLTCFQRGKDKAPTSSGCSTDLKTVPEPEILESITTLNLRFHQPTFISSRQNQKTKFLVNHALTNSKGHPNALFTQSCGGSWALRHRQRICIIEKQLANAGQFSEEVINPAY
jgi:hypothetical protein